VRSTQVDAQSLEISGNTARLQLMGLAEGALGADDELINGTVYVIPSRAIGGDPYLGGNDWQMGEIFIHGRAYPNQEIKYDLVTDDIILKTPQRDNIQHIMKVNKSQIDSFMLGNQLFVHDRHYFADAGKAIFYEEVYDGEVRVLRRYWKRFIDTYNSSNPMGKFSDVRGELFYLKGEHFININGAGSFLALFTKEQRREIRHFMASRHIRYKKATSAQMREVMEFCAMKKYF
jgi:hypothetical protein